MFYVFFSFYTFNILLFKYNLFDIVSLKKLYSFLVFLTITNFYPILKKYHNKTYLYKSSHILLLS